MREQAEHLSSKEELMRQLFSMTCYREGGHLFWNEKVGKKNLIGVEVGSINPTDGYRYAKCRGRMVAIHRAIFFLFNGYLPEQVDHINGNRQDNRPENLRSCSQTENQHNRIARGVHFNKRIKLYQAYIRLNRKRIHLGYYGDYSSARAAYLKAKTDLHPSAPPRCYESKLDESVGEKA